MTDQAADIRPGEELPLDALHQYLALHLPGFERIEQLRQFPGGYSNLTYLLITNLGEFVLRRPPFGANIKSAHDMGREFKVLRLLKDAGFSAPTPIHYCENTETLGAPFYLMERVHGLILRNTPPKEFNLSPEGMRAISEAAIDKLAALHALDIFQNNLIELGKPQGYTFRQTKGWIERYHNAQTDHIPAMEETASWLESHIPADPQPAFIHNDFKYDNLVLEPQNPSHILAVLDWEMATVGNPLMDLGTTLAYWTEAAEAKALPLAAANLSWLPGNLNRTQVLERYVAITGQSISDFVFYYAFGAFKVAVIIQQIYARYQKGHTRDPRFAALHEAVQHFGNLAAAAIAKNKISNLY